MEQQTVILLIIVALVALVVGILIGRAFSNSNNSVTKKAEKELEEYKTAVSEHFGKTADLIDSLTNSYKDVFDHLGSSARNLLSEKEFNEHLHSRASKSVTLTYESDKKDKPITDDDEK